MAARFDNDVANYLSRTTSLPSDALYTMMAWVKLSVDTNSWAASFSLNQASGAYHAMYTQSDGTTVAIYDGVTETPGSSLSVGTWYHLALRCNGTNMQGLLNGVQFGSNSFNNLASPSIIGLGRDFDGDALNGCVAHFKVWDAFLNDAEIAAEMAQSAPVRSADLNAWYPLTGDFEDKSGNGRHFTENGTVTLEDGPTLTTSFADTFDRADGDLDGSTSSDGLFTWSEGGGSAVEWEILSNQAQCVDIAADAFSPAITSVDANSADYSVEGTVSVFNRVSGSINLGLRIRCGTDAGYSVEMGTDSGGAASNFLKQFDTDDILDSDTGTLVEAGDVIRLEVQGANLTVYVNDVEIMSGSDATFAGSAGSRKAGLVSYSSVGVGNDVGFSSFAYGNLDEPWIPEEDSDRTIILNQGMRW